MRHPQHQRGAGRRIWTPPPPGLDVLFPASASQSLLWLPAIGMRAAANQDAASVDGDLTTWGTTNVDPTTDNGDGTYTINEDGTAASEHRINYTVTNDADTKLRYQIEAKARGRYEFAVYMSGVNEGKFFDVSAGTVGGNLTAAPDDATIVDLGDGWYRCTIDVDGAINQARIYLSNGSETISFDGLSQASLDVRNVSVTQLRSAALTDLGAGLHHASQATDANQPLWGENARGEKFLLDFDGTDDYMTLAAGGGWPAHTSHSIFLLLNRRASSGLQFVFDSTGGSNVLTLAQRATADNTIGYNAAGAWTDVADSVLGWQILEFHLDGDTNAGDVIRTLAASSTTLISGGAYATPVSLGGSVVLGKDKTLASRYADMQLADCALISRATGHPTGVLNERERNYVRRLMRWEASRERIQLA